MPIKLKNSQVTGRIPVANDLAIGEVALNTADGKLYTKHSDESIKLISPSKTDLDLNNVDNTSDANKPVSTAQATAIALKADVDTTYTKVETDAAVAALVNTVSTKVDKVTGKDLSTEDYTTAEKTKLTAVTGTNTGDETLATIKTKLGVTVLSGANTGDQVLPTLTSLGAQAAGTYATGTGSAAGTNTGDETLATIKTKLGVTTLSGSNTGDQVIPTTLPASDVSAWAKSATKPVYTATELGLGSVNNTTDLLKPISTATQTALDLKANQATTYTKVETDTRIQAVVGAAPVALDTLVEIAAQLASDESAAAALTTAVSLKAPLASPTFTGTVSGITNAMVGLGSVDNIADTAKPVSTAQAAAIAVETSRATAAEALLAPISTTYTKAQVDAAVAAVAADYATAAAAAAASVGADIVTPTNVSPTNALTSNIDTPTLTASAFYASYGHTMAASQWQVSTNSTFATTLISTGDIAGTTVSYTIPEATLATDTTYYWRCRYRNSMGGYSTWSSITSFTTPPVFVPTVAGTAYAGGFFAGKIVVDGLTYALVVAPKASGESTMKSWQTVSTLTAGALSLNDGLLNSNAMNNATHPATQFCRALRIGGYSDWYLPAKDELEILYRYLKPDSLANSIGNGANSNSLPVGAAYTVNSPTNSVSFAHIIGNAEAFTTNYWSSTQIDALSAWSQTFTTGAQLSASKIGTVTVRAVRKVLI